MASFFDKIISFFNNNSNEDSNIIQNEQDNLENLEDLIDVSWAGYYTK